MPRFYETTLSITNLHNLSISTHVNRSRINNTLKYKIMRANIEEYKAVENAAMKFVKSVAEGNSSYAKDLFVDEAVLFGYLDGKLEHGSIEQFYHNVDTVSAGNNFKARIDIVSVEETVAVVRVLEEKWGDRIDFTDYLLLLKINNEWKCVAKAYNQNSDTIQK